MKKSNAFVAIFCTITLVASLQVGTHAAGDTSVTYNSKGIIEYDDDKDGNAEIVFNAGDFQKIDDAVTAGKKEVANAISGLTGKTPVNNDFSTLAGAITSIPQDMSQNGDFGDVTANYVLKDKTFTSSVGVKQTGTMANNGAVSKTLDAGATYTIPAGYHNGSGKITVKNSSTTASAGDILTGKSVTINGTTTNGTMANKGGTTTAATSVTESGTNALITIPANGYYTTSSKISVPVETIKNNVSSLNSSFVISFPGETVGTTTTTTTHSKTATISLSWQGVLYLKCAYYGDYPGFETTSVLVNGTSMQKISSVSSSNKYDVWQLNMNGSSTITINYILCTNGYNTSGVTFTISGSQP